MLLVGFIEAAPAAGQVLVESFPEMTAIMPGCDKLLHLGN